MKTPASEDFHKNKPWHLLLKPHYFLAFGFGSGLLPKAPGTFGSLAALPLAWSMLGLTGWVQLLIILAVFLMGVGVSAAVSRETGLTDDSRIVVDEIVGMALTVFFLPMGAAWYWLIPGFLLFRIFDIVKPWPVGWVDRTVKGGLGIMLDDVVAALMAGGLLWGSYRVIAQASVPM